MYDDHETTPPTSPDAEEGPAAAPPGQPAPGPSQEPGPLPVARPHAGADPLPSGDDQTRRPPSSGAVVAIALAVALFAGSIAGGFGGFAGAWIATRTTAGTGPATVKVLPPETDEPVVAAAAAALPSVVNIDVSSAGRDAEDDDSVPQGHPDVPRRGNGSGVAFRTADGGTYILTNAHVVDGATRIVVTGTDRQRQTAELVGADAETDIAVVRIPGELPVVELGDSDDIRVGQSATAIGSPFGLELSVTSGVISAIGRSLSGSTGRTGVYPLVDVIQTDAAINPGNSGGALVDREGRLIGINTAIFTETGASGGIGFAVPVNTAVRIADQLINDGRAQHPFLGIIGQDVTPEFAEVEGLPVDEGAYVVEPIPGTMAEAAGLAAGDVIVSLDDVTIRSMDDLLLAVRRHRIGDRVTVGLWRDGERTEVEMEVGIKPDDLEAPTPPQTPEPPAEEPSGR